MYLNIPSLLKSQLDNAPQKPGVYMFQNDQGEKLYVGKAVNLYNRSRSYFLNYRRLDPRLQTMVENATSVEYVIVANEVEALLLETNLIKKYQPRFNVLMTDDKSYIWVKVQSQLDFPIVRIVRDKKDDGADYFGPYPAKTPVKRLLKNIRKVFPYRTCNREIVEQEDGSIRSSDRKPCLYYHLGLCSAPCTTQQPKQNYRAIVNNLKKFLRSEHDDLKGDLKRHMTQFAQRKEFEQAARVRDQLKDIEYITQYSRIDEQMDEFKLAETELVGRYQGLRELVEKLTASGLVFDTGEAELANMNEDYWSRFKIECYDISNIQGTNAVAAMVVAVGGKPQNSLYRKFKIKTKDTPDDFAMLQETLQRRFKYLLPQNNETARGSNAKTDESFSQAPQLLVIDGGKGQLSSVLEILSGYWPQIGYEIPCIGLAKREEEIVIKVKGDFKIIKLSKRSAALRILQNIRDEAHRFGIGYHRKLRSKGMVYSELELIPGVGEVTKQRLILAFGSVAGIRKAKIEEIESVVKNRSTAAKIKKLLLQ